MSKAKDREKIRIDYTQTLVNKACKTAKKQKLVLTQDAAILLENFISGQINDNQLQSYEGIIISDEVVQNTVLEPLIKKGRSIKLKGGKKTIKKRARKVTKQFVKSLCDLQKIQDKESTELQRETLVKGLQVSVCQVWPICRIE